jgi:hypothetical protein
MSFKTIISALLLSTIFWMLVICYCYGGDSLTLPYPPHAALTWEHDGADSYEVVIAEQGCHIGGWGLHRQEVIEKQFDMGSICSIDFYRDKTACVRAKLNNLISDWTIGNFQ